MKSIEDHIEYDKKIADDPQANPAARRHAKDELHDLEEYVEHHKKVWPEMLGALRKHGWRNYSIFLKPS